MPSHVGVQGPFESPQNFFRVLCAQEIINRQFGGWTNIDQILPELGGRQAGEMVPDTAFQVDDLEAMLPETEEVTRSTFQRTHKHRNIVEVVGDDSLFQSIRCGRQFFRQLEETCFAQCIRDLAVGPRREFLQTLAGQQSLRANRYAAVQVGVIGNCRHELQPVRVH